MNEIGTESPLLYIFDYSSIRKYVNKKLNTRRVFYLSKFKNNNKKKKNNKNERKTNAKNKRIPYNNFHTIIFQQN